ncbi:unnamed protein product [Parascedosporium putredinis]|uniref:Uncharacterized protein n=1 Tax=Parascedosporium putredinis TaxID=1442378 RepID=A0A9P1MAG5_9PEZI|nr:unnamed protein product [Parascedosporium putredinis]CAI7997622.1 unnamed protein product [Parascedosporium putredinis]
MRTPEFHEDECSRYFDCPTHVVERQLPESTAAVQLRLVPVPSSFPFEPRASPDSFDVVSDYRPDPAQASKPSSSTSSPKHPPQYAGTATHTTKHERDSFVFGNLFVEVTPSEPFGASFTPVAARL